jgi:outer membrane protein assembly factor BamB
MRRQFIALSLAAGLLSGCSMFDGLFGSSEPPPLPGTRVAVIQGNSGLAADPAVAGQKILLPEPYINGGWEQPGGSPAHAMYHLNLADNPQYAWSASIGDGNDDDAAILSEPVVVGDVVFTMDARSTVTAYRQSDGSRFWEADLTQEEEDGYFGGGLAYEDGKLFVTTGFGIVFALDAKNGNELWRQDLKTPMRAAPTASGGRVFVLTFDNQTFALAASDGRKLWNHTGIQEAANLLGTASPAVSGGTVIIPYSSGEIYALQVENGREIWSDSLAALRRTDPLADIAQIRGLPVIDRGIVYVVSHAGRTVAFDLKRGSRIWEREFGGTETPWAAGDYIYMLTNDDELVCLTRETGKVRWVTPLPRYEDPTDKSGVITWTGPVLASDRLIVAGSLGDAYAISPYTGEIIGVIALPSGAAVSPIVVNNTLYFISDDADIVALR